jgi:hypothetical protein
VHKGAVAGKLHNPYSTVQAQITAFTQWKKHFFYISPISVVWWHTISQTKVFTTIH